MQKSRVLSVTLVLVAAALVASGCGKKGNTDNGDKGGSSGQAKGPRVGLVTDIGGLNDRSFNFLANKGFEKAKDELGATGSVIESKSASDYGPNLGQLVTGKSELVIGVGFLMGDAVKEAAAKAPDTKFAIIDFSYNDFKTGKWAATDNIVGLLFKEQEAGYLAGVLAGAVEEKGELDGLNDKKVVSVVGGQAIPPVDRYIAGFQAGVEAQCKDCKVIVDYSQSFIDQAGCQDRAKAQIEKGSDIVFQVAGQCGLGALDAAKEAKVWGIGVDADQSYLGDHILTSAMKRIDVAVFQTIKAVEDGEFTGGQDRTFGLEEDGVGLGKVAAAASDYQSVVDDASEAILAGDVKVPDTR